jgi:hypothetical protein
MAVIVSVLGGIPASPVIIKKSPWEGTTSVVP